MAADRPNSNAYFRHSLVCPLIRRLGCSLISKLSGLLFSKCGIGQDSGALGLEENGGWIAETFRSEIEGGEGVADEEGEEERRCAAVRTLHKHVDFACKVAEGLESRDTGARPRGIQMVIERARNVMRWAEIPSRGAVSDSSKHKQLLFKKRRD
jgi:hypothetical protein